MKTDLKDAYKVWEVPHAVTEVEETIEVVPQKPSTNGHTNDHTESKAKPKAKGKERPVKTPMASVFVYDAIGLIPGWYAEVPLEEILRNVKLKGLYKNSDTVGTKWLMGIMGALVFVSLFVTVAIFFVPVLVLPIIGLIAAASGFFSGWSIAQGNEIPSTYFFRRRKPEEGEKGYGDHNAVIFEPIDAKDPFNSYPVDEKQMVARPLPRAEYFAKRYGMQLEQKRRRAGMSTLAKLQIGAVVILTGIVLIALFFTIAMFWQGNPPQTPPAQ